MHPGMILGHAWWHVAVAVCVAMRWYAVKHLYVHADPGSSTSSSSNNALAVKKRVGPLKQGLLSAVEQKYTRSMELQRCVVH